MHVQVCSLSTHRFTPEVQPNDRQIDTLIELGSESIDVDYVITHPTAASYVVGSARTQLRAASHADTRKITYVPLHRVSYNAVACSAVNNGDDYVCIQTIVNKARTADSYPVISAVSRSVGYAMNVNFKVHGVFRIFFLKYKIKDNRVRVIYFSTYKLSLSRSLKDSTMH